MDGLTASLVHAEPAGNTAGLRVAIVHEWLDTFAGSERVLEQLLLCYPTAELFVVADFLPEGEREFLRGRKITTSFIQRMPMARRHLRAYVGLMPLAVEQFDLRGFDLVISSHHAVAKGVITGPGQVHVSYVHSPMRYAWDLQPDYLSQSGLDRGLKGAYARWLLSRLRRSDVHSANRVDRFVANSSYIASRIWKVYRREATVIHPPVAVDRFSPHDTKSDFYLAASRQVPYKRIDLIAAAFARMPDKRLVIVGDGPDHAHVAAAAAGAPNIELRPPVPQAELVALMQRARAAVVAAEEDFGISMVEAQSCGTPVIAFGRGGAADIVSTGKPAPRTGVLFHKQSPEAIIGAVERFEALRGSISPAACRDNALRFSEGHFRDAMTRFVARAVQAGSAPGTTEGAGYGRNWRVAVS